jgi:hypothetical protein
LGAPFFRPRFRGVPFGRKLTAITAPAARQSIRKKRSPPPEVDAANDIEGRRVNPASAPCHPESFQVTKKYQAPCLSSVTDLERQLSSFRPPLLRFRLVLDRHYVVIANPPIEILTTESPVAP